MSATDVADSEVIATVRPYDDPGVPRVYYRLTPERETILAKTHIPYALGPERMAKFRAWFLTPAYAVNAMPSYAPATASNPFIAFSAMPVDSRYRFMLDEAQYFIMNFIKGPVCRGQIALDVIEDRFWVYFIDPRGGLREASAELLVRQADDLRLPAEQGSNAGAIGPWLEYARLERRYLQAKSQALDQALAAPGKDNLSLIWDGDGRNPNAALTIFRHSNSASVVQGLVGDQPKTAWVIGYPLFERIYYLLVAGYDVYGNLGHQLLSRLYMDFMRMEGEFNFLVLLPKAARQPTAEYWYRGAPDEAKEYVYGRNASFDRESGIDRLAEQTLALAAVRSKCRNRRDNLYQDLAPVQEMGATIERSESRDYDLLEALLIRLRRDLKQKKRKGTGAFADGIARSDVLGMRATLQEDLDRFQRQAEASLAAQLRGEMWELVTLYDELKRRSGKLDFVDLLLRTRDLVRDDAEVRRYLQQQFTHIFIDEFQDTDPLQAEILLLLAADDPAETSWRNVRPAPGKLFVVGDPKQSVYRFRRADVLLYQAVQDALLDRGVRAVHLSKSFRAVRPIHAVPADPFGDSFVVRTTV